MASRMHIGCPDAEVRQSVRDAKVNHCLMLLVWQQGWHPFDEHHPWYSPWLYLQTSLA